jgi:hypothetical protein
MWKKQSSNEHYLSPYLKVPELDRGAGAASRFGVQPEDAESFSALGAPGKGGGGHPHRGAPLVVGHRGRVAIFLFFSSCVLCLCVSCLSKNNRTQTCLVQLYTRVLICVLCICRGRAFAPPVHNTPALAANSPTNMGQLCFFR